MKQEEEYLCPRCHISHPFGELTEQEEKIRKAIGSVQDELLGPVKSKEGKEIIELLKGKRWDQ